MINSMTGYGKAEVILPSGKLIVEIRTLNSKNADINLKTTLLPKDKELSIRQKLAEQLKRGTIDFFASFEPNVSETAKKINAEVVKEYFRQLSDISGELGIDKTGLLEIAMRLPDVMDTQRKEIISDENWQSVESTIDEAIEAVKNYRVTEGKALYKDVTTRVNNILELQKEVEKFDGERIEAIRNKISSALEELQQKVDPARFEQEMIFYLEKLDINEEKVRLRQHCKYFMDTIDNENEPGKKLGFIIQEMGREINTTGSKANFAAIQQIVVKMKDELEKIREQSLNIL